MLPLFKSQDDLSTVGWFMVIGAVGPSIVTDVEKEQEISLRISTV